MSQQIQRNGKTYVPSSFRQTWAYSLSLAAIGELPDATTTKTISPHKFMKSGCIIRLVNIIISRVRQKRRLFLKSCVKAVFNISWVNGLMLVNTTFKLNPYLPFSPNLSINELVWTHLCCETSPLTVHQQPSEHWSCRHAWHHHGVCR